MGRERIISLPSYEKTIEVGRSIGVLLRPNTILALSGDLGAGKTTFVQGIALGLQIKDPVQSPTFVYFNQYEGTLPLFHFDLYRMKNSSDFLGLGFDEYFHREGICAIEWPERITDLLLRKALFFSFSHLSHGRIVSISGDIPKNLIDYQPIWL